VSLFCITTGISRKTKLLNISDYQIDNFSDEKLPYGIISDFLTLIRNIEINSNITDIFTHKQINADILIKGLEAID